MPDPDKKTIVLLERSRVLAAQVSLQSDKDPEITFESPWNSESLVAVFANLKDELDIEQLNLVLSEELYLLFTETIRKDSQLSDQTIYAAAESYLQQDISELGIDYQQLDSTKTHILVQILAVKKSLLSLIGQASQANDLPIAALEPRSISLARLTSSYKTGHIILYQSSERVYAAVVKQQQVYSVAKLPRSVDDKHLSSLLSYSEETYDLPVKTIVTTEALIDMAKKSKTSVKTKDLNPFVGAAGNDEFVFDEADEIQASQIFGEDDESDEELVEEEIVETPVEKGDDNQADSSIMDQSELAAPKPPLKVVESDSSMESTPIAPTKNKSNAKLIILIVTILVVLIGLVGGGFFVYQNALSEGNQSPQVIESDATPTPEPQETSQPATEASDSAETTDDETATTSDIEAAELSIQVLNGSGVPGAAGDVADLLEAGDVEDIDTGNASTFDYTETEISVKDGESELFSFLEGLLEDDYTITQGDDISDSSSFDAVITVGKE